jgi:hypothetical protein
MYELAADHIKRHPQQQKVFVTNDGQLFTNKAPMMDHMKKPENPANAYLGVMGDQVFEDNKFQKVALMTFDDMLKKGKDFLKENTQHHQIYVSPDGHMFPTEQAFQSHVHHQDKGHYTGILVRDGKLVEQVRRKGVTMNVRREDMFV